MLRTLFIDSFHHGSFSPFAARAAFPEENCWRRWKSPERSAAVGEDEDERLLEEEKSLRRWLGDGDGGNLGILEERGF